jgi:hypothetical protein
VLFEGGLSWEGMRIEAATERQTHRYLNSLRRWKANVLDAKEMLCNMFGRRLQQASREVMRKESDELRRHPLPRRELPATPQAALSV